MLLMGKAEIIISGLSVKTGCSYHWLYNNRIRSVTQTFYVFFFCPGRTCTYNVM